MFSLRFAQEKDLEFWISLDGHIREISLTRKLRNRECYILCSDGVDVGVMRYNLFWDNTPFLNMIYIAEEFRGKGIGKQAMAHWESDMKALGFSAVMTSSQADENAQHFYRKLGYKDCGCLILDIPEMEQPAEIFFIKSLKN